MSERPFVRHTWALKGQTPIIRSSGSWKKLTLSGVILADVAGQSPRLLVRSLAGNMNAAEAQRFLGQLKRHLGGRKLLLIWDGLPAHRAKTVQAHIRNQAAWLRVERLPAYAPELNPIEYLWACLKRKHLGNLGGDFRRLGVALRRCRRSIRDPDLLRGCLTKAGFYG